MDIFMVSKNTLTRTPNTTILGSPRSQMVIASDLQRHRMNSSCIIALRFQFHQLKPRVRSVSDLSVRCRHWKANLQETVLRLRTVPQRQMGRNLAVAQSVARLKDVRRLLLVSICVVGTVEAGVVSILAVKSVPKVGAHSAGRTVEANGVKHQDAGEVGKRSAFVSNTVRWSILHLSPEKRLARSHRFRLRTM